uniref:Uncharacterized protein n=1 Tax=Ignavibacterium album TaxID=591197 RepID=A0A7V2ZIA4_9BACT
MAQLKKQVLGKVRGKVGDLVFRNRHETNYVSLRPIRFNAPMDDRAIARRNKFKSAVQLASAMNSIIPLKQSWNMYSSGTNTVYNRMVKANFGSLENLLPSQNTLLTPGRGFGVVVQNTELSQEQMRLSIDALGDGSGIDTQIEKNIRLACVLCLSEPLNQMDAQFVYLSFISVAQNLVLNSPLDFTIALNSSEKEIFNNYGMRKLLAGLITFDAEQQVVSFSNTIFLQQ